MAITSKTWLNSSTRRNLDQGILLVVFTLIGIGLVQVYSASYIFATDTRGDGLFFLKRQLFFAVIAFGGLVAMARVPLHWLKRLALPPWILLLLFLVGTLIPGFGSRAGGSYRWVELGIVRFEPSELLKIFFPLATATLLLDRYERLGNWDWPVRLGLLLLPFPILLKQPDFGSFALCFAVLIAILFANGISWRFFAVGGILSIPLFWTLLLAKEYRRARLQSFIDPWADPANAGFQVIQSLLSFFTGGLTGVGLGEGQGKLFFLPEAHTDFTLAVLGRETGFIGVMFLLSLYFFLVFRGFQVATKTQDRFFQLVAVGIITLFSLQVFVNFGVATGILPTKGLTLPFLSYGGSSLISSGLLFGMLLNIARRTGK